VSYQHSVAQRDFRATAFKGGLQPLLQRKCACGNSTGLAASECEECKQKLQRRAGDGDAPAVAPPIVHEVLKSPGQPLDREARAFMEPRFGHDFSRVRIHTDDNAAESARAVNALAYTVGSNIVLGHGKHAPSSISDRRLLAHELTHVVQQGESTLPPVGALAIGPPQSKDEDRADVLASAVMAGSSASPSLSSLTMSLLQRQDAGKKEAQKLPQTEVQQNNPEVKTPDVISGAGAVVVEPLCAPKALARQDFLTHQGATTNDFGLTSLATSLVTYPTVSTVAVKGGVVVSPTSAALPQIPSVYTGAGRFVEGDAEVLGQESRGCPSKKYPLLWVIETQGAQKIAEGEQEHCSDYQYAFDISLRRYADAVNAAASSKRVFADDKAADAYFKRTVGVAPADWHDTFVCLAKKSLRRDPTSPGNSSWHTPRPSRLKPDLPDCNHARAVITGNSLPEVGKHSSAEVINGCGEAPAVRGRTGAR